MFTVPLKPKHRKAHRQRKTAGINFDVPDNWADFARLTQIRSGRKLIYFEPYDYQVKLIDIIENSYATVIGKTRQVGGTESIASYFLWKACRNPGYVAVVLSKGQSDTSNIAMRIRKMLFPLMSQGLLETATDNLTDIQIVGGGRLIFRSSTPNGVRGLESVSDILFDEWAFVDDADLIYSAAIPSTEMVGDEARLIFISTPNGRVGQYWEKLNDGNGKHNVDKYCEQIRNGDCEPFVHWVDNAGWSKVLLHWKAHPVYSKRDDYLEEIRTKKKLNETVIQREYNLSFDDTDLNVFPYQLVELAATGDFEPYREDHTYYMGVDVSTIGDDYTCAIVVGFNGSLYKVVGMYRQRKASFQRNFEGISELVKTYKPNRVGIEVTGGVGQLYFEKLVETYPGVNATAIKTTGDSKPIMIQRSVQAHEQGKIRYPVGIITDEHKAFIRTGNGQKMEASNGNHDDTVMGLAFALAVSNFGKQSTFEIQMREIL